MKKILISILIATALLFPNVVLADDFDISVNINNTSIQFDVQPQTINNRTMVPMRKIFEALGATVSWDETTQTATGKKGDVVVNVTIGSKTLFKNSMPVLLDTAALVIDGRTLVPVRAVAESFNCTVDWDEATHTVNITTSEQQGTIQKQKLTAEQIADKASPAVFYVELYDNNSNPIASGSGFFIDTDGTAVTNYHVIEGTSSAYITTTNGKVYPVENILKYDEELDLAVITVGKTDTQGATVTNFPFLEMANSNNIKAGQIVYAIGSPEGLQNTISDGIISNTKQIMEEHTYIQTTAAISSGSSGGALLNEYGEVIGVTSAGIKTGENLGFVIPINAVNSINKNNVTISYDDFAKLTESLQLAVSATEISIELGKSDTIYVYAGGTSNSNWSIYYEIANNSISSCEWGDWLDEYPDICPLYIYADAVGETYVRIYSDMKSEEKYIKVNVTAPTIEYYPGTSTPTYTYYSGRSLYEYSHDMYIYIYDESIFDYIEWLVSLGYYKINTVYESYGTSYSYMDQYDNYLGITFAAKYNQVWIYAK